MSDLNARLEIAVQARPTFYGQLLSECKAEIDKLTAERDDLLWLCEHDYRQNENVTDDIPSPDWVTVSRSMQAFERGEGIPLSEVIKTLRTKGKKP